MLSVFIFLELSSDRLSSLTELLLLKPLLFPLPFFCQSFLGLHNYLLPFFLSLKACDFFYSKSLFYSCTRSLDCSWSFGHRLLWFMARCGFIGLLSGLIFKRSNTTTHLLLPKLIPIIIIHLSDQCQIAKHKNNYELLICLRSPVLVAPKIVSLLKSI